jgi:hypothetical protein
MARSPASRREGRSGAANDAVVGALEPLNGRLQAERGVRVVPVPRASDRSFARDP